MQMLCALCTAFRIGYSSAHAFTRLNVGLSCWTSAPSCKMLPQQSLMIHFFAAFKMHHQIHGIGTYTCSLSGLLEWSFAISFCFQSGEKQSNCSEALKASLWFNFISGIQHVCEVLWNKILMSCLDLLQARAFAWLLCAVLHTFLSNTLHR